MLRQNNFRKVAIGTIFDFPETNSKITKKFCNHHKGAIPVYASSRSEFSVLGHIEDNIPGVKYYANCLSWNRNGSVGYVFLREHKFATNEDHRAMVIKKQFVENLDKLYLKFEIERQLFTNGFSYIDKCGVGKIQEVEIYIPVDSNGNFNKDEQIRLANQYISVEKIKKELSLDFTKIDTSVITVPNSYPVISIELGKLFYIKKGNSKYTKKYLHNNHGTYPLYSSQTSNFGELGKIDTFDFDEECFTWTTDGVYAGTIFYRNGKFSITTHCGVLSIRPEYKRSIDHQYLSFKLNELLPNNTLGEGANRRIGIERINELSIEMPADNDNNPDLLRQQLIADKYNEIYKIKSYLKTDYRQIINSSINIVDEALITVI